MEFPISCIGSKASQQFEAPPDLDTQLRLVARIGCASHDSLGISSGSTSLLVVWNLVFLALTLWIASFCNLCTDKEERYNRAKGD